MLLTLYVNERRKSIEHEIKSLFNGSSKKPTNVAKEHLPLYSKARKAFGSWKRALEACEIDYEKARNNEKWTREKVANEIKKLHLSGCSLKPKVLREAGNIKIISAARYHFGSWSKALKYSGVYYTYERRSKKNYKLEKSCFGDVRKRNV